VVQAHDIHKAIPPKKNPEEGMMITKRMIMSNELAAKIKDAKNILEEIAGSNKTTDATSEWLYNLCELLDEVC